MPDDGNYVLEPEAVCLLEQYRIPYPDHGVAHDAEEAARMAEELGCPVVLKVVSPDVLHKSDVGGVLVGLTSASEVRQGFGTLVERVTSKAPQARIEGVLICKQAASGLEVIVGALEDVTFGPTVMFGLGGIFAEVLRDVTFRVAPLTRHDGEEMVRELRGYPLLSGARGHPARDVDALVNLLLSVSQLVMERGNIEELDLNPVRLFEQGLLVLDARMIVKKNDGQNDS